MSECGTDSANNTSKCNTQGIDLQCYLILNSATQKSFIAVLCILVGTLCILENSLVLFILWSSARLRKKPSYMFISSLALADLLASLVFSYSFVDFHVFHGGGTLVIFLFKLGGVTMSFTASLGSLLLMAFDRYICIHKPSAYKAIVTRKRALLALVMMWITTVFISFLPLMGVNCCQLQTSCSELFPLIDNRYLASWIVLVMVLLMFIIFSYALIMWKVRSHSLYMERYNKQNEQGKRRLRIDLMLAKTLTLVLSVLVVCWSPALFMMIHSLLFSLSKTTKAIFAFCSTLCLINSMVNPIIYAWRSGDLRSKIIRGLTKCKCPLRLTGKQPDGDDGMESPGINTICEDTVCDTEISK
ncbi:cannabinoid receptor 2 [Spea bombifrons]|uniref:cannabinoid receptor 2 n=1 Tax=Spea bombifrons TaxID=233779 RepID=UPI002349252B|nr:cannabinoid receptor 2 [Spea bombifrons]